jgi:outer membrane murein-binding lipoprotein Lpp
MNAKIILTAIVVSLLFLSGCANPPVNTQAPKVNTNLQFSVKQEKQETKTAGAPYEITVDNCNGARDSEKTEERSKTYLTELNLEVSNKVAAEIGGNVEVAKVMLSDEIGLALGIRIGTQTESKSSVKIVTPAGQKTIAHLQWEEVWTSGTVAISRPDGSYVDVLPFSVLNSLTLEQLDTQTVNCETGAIVENGSTAQISTPAVPVIPPTPAPVSIGTITVPGNSSEGIRFNVTQTGTYIFKYVSGSYSTYPANKTPPAGVMTWLTAVRVFKNRPVAWNGDAISEQNDYRIVDYAYFPNASEAEAAAQGHSLTVSLLNGDYLILVGVDGKQYYSDNPGEVVLEVLYTPSQ